MSKYYFEGDIIKINAEDFQKWQEIYTSLDVLQELRQMDLEFKMRKDSGETMKKWFPEAYKRLNGRNKREKSTRPKSKVDFKTTRQMTLSEELNDVSWAENNIDERN